MITARQTKLSTYLTDLLSAGRITFTRDEATRSLMLNRRAFLDAAERLQHKGYLVSPRHGFYIIVPPQYLSWGGPPPSWYIDDLMRYENCRYYVGVLKAAELHGAAHQAVMAFQVISDKRLPKIHIGRSAITFYYRKDIARVESATVKHKTEAGTMMVSSPELTAFDLVRYSRAAVGLDNIATVLAELSAKLDAMKLMALAPSFERSIVQRVGYLLDRTKRDDLTQPLRASLEARKPNWIELDATETRDADFTPPPLERNPRWKIIVRRLPEVDE